MAFTLKKSGPSILCPAGAHVVRCCMLVDMGTHSVSYQNKLVGDRQKILIGFEFPTELHVFDEKKGEEPFMISSRFTNSLHEKSKLPGFLMSWAGKPMTQEELAAFDLTKLVDAENIGTPKWKGGATGVATVLHKPRQDGGHSAVITGVSPMVKGMTCPPPFMKPICYSVDEGPDSPKFKTLSEWIQDECWKCAEWAGKKRPGKPAVSAQTPPPDEDGADETETTGGNNPF